MCQGGWACKQGWRADSSSKTVDKNTIRAPSLGSTFGTESLTGERKPLDHLGDIFCHWAETISGFPGGASGKEPICQYRRLRKLRFNPWVRKISWNRTWQPAPVFLPVEFHGQRSLVGYGQTWLMGLSTSSRDYFIRSRIDLSQISLKIPLPLTPCASGSNRRISFFFFFFGSQIPGKEVWKIGGGEPLITVREAFPQYTKRLKSCCYAVRPSTKSTPQKHARFYQNTVIESRARVRVTEREPRLWHLLCTTLGQLFSLTQLHLTHPK